MYKCMNSNELSYKKIGVGVLISDHLKTSLAQYTKDVSHWAMTSHRRSTFLDGVCPQIKYKYFTKELYHFSCNIYIRHNVMLGGNTK